MVIIEDSSREKTKREAETKVEINLLSAFNVRLEGFSSEQVLSILEKVFNLRGLLTVAALLIIIAVVKMLNY